MTRRNGGPYSSIPKAKYTAFMNRVLAVLDEGPCTRTTFRYAIAAEAEGLPPSAVDRALRYIMEELRDAEVMTKIRGSRRRAVWALTRRSTDGETPS